MKYNTLIFDLDGTLSDPKEGIIRSINYALERHGFDQYPEESLLFCIGPPLDQSLKQLTKVTDETILHALVATFRERYARVGYSENVIYAGIKEVLTTLREKDDIKIGLCTSKRVDFAHQILDMFGLSDFFDFVDGGEIGVHKENQLERLLDSKTITPQSVMIGDRYIDIEAAHANHLDAAGVLWGYGSEQELSACRPRFLFETPEQLISLID